MAVKKEIGKMPKLMKFMKCVVAVIAVLAAALVLGSKSAQMKILMCSHAQRSRVNVRKGPLNTLSNSVRVLVEGFVHLGRLKTVVLRELGAIMTER